ncbi:MAG: universal stress protein [Chitinophagaceae bacterium]|jgi:nucleotide-binding universal stress UspA family protein|nr:universal stress protein [Chitinophagaceae bacterium]
MKKIVVPVDFSDASRNAATYTALMSNDIPESELLLYNVYDKFSAGTDGSLLAEEEDAMKIISDNALHNLRNEILPLTKSTIGILSENGTLAVNLEKLVLRNGIDLVVMGINGASKLEQVLIGSNTLDVIKKDSFPVLIVPPLAKYARIHTAVFASDFKDVRKSTPVVALRNLLDLFRPDLHVIHIDEEQVAHMGDDFKKEKGAMDELLRGFNPEYSFLEAHDFVKGINNYVKDHHADLIITVPHRHNFIADLFSKTHTEKLVYHTDVPVLAVHE